MEKLLYELNSVTWEDLKEETIEAAKLVLLDTIGAYISGINQPDVQKVVQTFAERGNYKVLHTEQSASISNAAFIHGTATVAVEMDEGNQYSKGHPAAHVVPVLLTLIQNKEGVNGKDFLLNLIKGYEACSRFGRAATLHPDMHAHGTWGTMGAAATALFFENLSTDDLLEGINISVSFSLPTAWNSAIEGKFIRNVYTGHAIEAGIRSLRLTQAGCGAPKNNASHVFSKLLGLDWNENELNFTEKEQWDIETNYFKAHAFCRYTHAPLDAFKRLVNNHKVTAEQIESVDVRTYSRAASLSNQEYHNALSAKFSIPYALASWMYLRKSDQTIFTEQWLEDSQIKAFARKIFVFKDEKFEENYPQIMPASVKVKLISGEELIIEIDGAQGGPNCKFSKDDIVDKFKNLTRDYFNERQIEEIISFVLNIETVKNVNVLETLLRKKETVSL